MSDDRGWRADDDGGFSCRVSGFRRQSAESRGHSEESRGRKTGFRFQKAKCIAQRAKRQAIEASLCCYQRSNHLNDPNQRNHFPDLTIQPFNQSTKYHLTIQPLPNERNYSSYFRAVQRKYFAQIQSPNAIRHQQGVIQPKDVVSR